jgi:hypothetical protein
MNDSPPESQQEQNKRFQKAIRQKWQCESSHNRDQPCDLPPHAKGSASVYDLNKPPRQHPEAKQCCVWDGKDFKPGENGVIIVLDVQVPCDLQDLPRMAIWGWLTNSLAKDPDVYVTSQKWSKAQIHGGRVNFGSPVKGYEAGKFFVRERADGKISVRIIKQVIVELNRKKEYIEPSFCLALNEIERIEHDPDSELFSLFLP